MCIYIYITKGCWERKWKLQLFKGLESYRGWVGGVVGAESGSGALM